VQQETAQKCRAFPEREYAAFLRDASDASRKAAKCWTKWHKNWTRLGRGRKVRLFFCNLAPVMYASNIHDVATNLQKATKNIQNLLQFIKSYVTLRMCNRQEAGWNKVAGQKANP